MFEASLLVEDSRCDGLKLFAPMGSQETATCGPDVESDKRFVAWTTENIRNKNG